MKCSFFEFDPFRRHPLTLKRSFWMTFVIPFSFFFKVRVKKKYILKILIFFLVRWWSLYDVDLFQRGCGSRPEILDQKWSPGSSVWGKDFAVVHFFKSFRCSWLKNFDLGCSLTSTRSLPVCVVTSFENLSKVTNTLVSVSGRISSSTSRWIVFLIGS